MAALSDTDDDKVPSNAIPISEPMFDQMSAVAARNANAVALLTTWRDSGPEAAYQLLADQALASAAEFEQLYVAAVALVRAQHTR